MIDWNQLQKDVEASTPGPWHVGKDSEERYGGWFVGGGRFVRANIVGPHHEAEYNARLIASAPDLAALALAGKRLADAVQHEREMVCQDFDLQRKASEAVDAALNAFRKAEGESHE